MRNFLRVHGGWVWGSLLTLTALISAATQFFPELPRALQNLWPVAWLLFAASIIAVVRLLQVDDKKRIKLMEMKGSTAQLEDELKASQADTVRVTKSLERVEAELHELQESAERARLRIAELETPAPTRRDQELFDRIITEWPWNEGSIWWLDEVFNGKSWSSETASQVVNYATLERETYFDNPVVDEVYQKFKSACNEMSIWLTLKSFPNRDNGDLQEIPDGYSRAGGWPEFDAERAEGRELGYKVVDARRKLEEVGRLKGL